MLLDVNQNLKLSDFNRGIKTKKDIMVLTKPYGRLLNAEDGEGASTYGIAGA